MRILAASIPYIHNANGATAMTKQEMIQRMKAAAALIDTSDLPEGFGEEEKDAFADYWANSASQSYCNAVAQGNVREVQG